MGDRPRSSPAVPSPPGSPANGTRDFGLDLCHCQRRFGLFGLRFRRCGRCRLGCCRFRFRRRGLVRFDLLWRDRLSASGPGFDWLGLHRLGGCGLGLHLKRHKLQSPFLQGRAFAQVRPLSPPTSAIARFGTGFHRSTTDGTGSGARSRLDLECKAGRRPRTRLMLSWMKAPRLYSWIASIRV